MDNVLKIPVRSKNAVGYRSGTLTHLRLGPTGLPDVGDTVRLVSSDGFPYWVCDAKVVSLSALHAEGDEQPDWVAELYATVIPYVEWRGTSDGHYFLEVYHDTSYDGGDLSPLRHSSGIYFSWEAAHEALREYASRGFRIFAGLTLTESCSVSPKK